MKKRTFRDEIARIILFECSIFESDVEIRANLDHPHVQKAYKAADRIDALRLVDAPLSNGQQT